MNIFLINLTNLICAILFRMEPLGKILTDLRLIIRQKGNASEMLNRKRKHLLKND